MALDQAANFVVDELQSSVSDTATTFSVANASQFPDPANGEYNLVVFDASRPSKDPDVEVVRVTGRDTTNDALTVTRGQETTTAVSHASGAAVELSYTAKFRDDIQTELDNAGGTTVTSIAPTEAVAGEEPSASGSDAIAIGPSGSASAGGDFSVTIGNLSEAPNTKGTALGRNTTASGEKATAVGNGASATDTNAIAIGQSDAGYNGIAMGYFSDATGSSAVAIGDGAEATHDNSIALGRDVKTDTSGQLVINLGFDNRVLSMDSNGNLTIKGSLTENGSP